MEPFIQIKSKVVPIPRSDIDTDMLIPAQYLTSISKEGYGENLFRRLRDEEPDFPLNQEKFEGAQILVAQNNFGCGSSREHAVWALMGWGFRVVIAPSFSDIFFSNSGKNGLVLVELPQEIVAEILEAAKYGNAEMSVDLKIQTVTLPDGTLYEFEFDPFRKDCILRGQDDLDYLLSHKKEIETWQAEREKQLFYSTTEPNHPEVMQRG
ncbi:MAG: 3-isopropylmalate dehydratase small subunit [Candidatus Peregrinibacteria bacterium]|nr:3-isopropylmalate dehydratase small subunit [Candidatus Peregrinibacteria bacterium]